MLRQGLTQKQEQVLNYIESYFNSNQQTPTLAEIAIFLGVSTKATVVEHLSGLEKKGFINRIPGAFRGILLNSIDEGSVEIPMTSVPLKGLVAAGQPIEAIDWFESVSVPKKIIGTGNKRHFALQVKGNSMIEDGIYDGEIIIAEESQTADNGDLVVAQDENGNVTLKYFYREFNRIRLEPRNNKFSPIYMDNCIILGILKGLTTKQYIDLNY